ncbi:hypothetical protein SBV1_30046 [Verrucomicrobia bacterium]|nr:hypothetical protein SBV1_30046 [Verrucomicrobiota bacterium]
MGTELRACAKINSDFHARSTWGKPTRGRYRAHLAFESGSKPHALQTLRESGRHSIAKRAGG